MKNSIFIPVGLVIVFLISACAYSDDGVFAVVPVPDDPPVVWAATNLDSIENPVVADSLEVKYDISIQNGELYVINVTLGSEPYLQSDSTHGSFWMYAYDSELPGIDTLRMNIYYSSNTNSLADLLGLEARNLTLKYAIDFNWSIK
jgi:hypothetical protein